MISTKENYKNTQKQVNNIGIDSYSNNKSYEIKSITNNYIPSFKPKNSFNKYISALANIYPSVWI